MLVEDEIITATALKKSLENLGYAISAVVDSGEDAIAKAGEDKPDLVIMDITLKGEMDGIEAAKVIRSKFEIPVIYLSAHSEDSILERAKITEPFGYIIKPYQIRELHITIEMGLYKHKAETERKRLFDELQEALSKVKTLSGLLPICSSCKKVRDDKGYWSQIETYISKHSEAGFTHGICPGCQQKLYPQLFDKPA